MAHSGAFFAALGPSHTRPSHGPGSIQRITPFLISGELEDFSVAASIRHLVLRGDSLGMVHTIQISRNLDFEPNCDDPDGQWLRILTPPKGKDCEPVKPAASTNQRSCGVVRSIIPGFHPGDQIQIPARAPFRFRPTRAFLPHWRFLMPAHEFKRLIWILIHVNFLSRTNQGQCILLSRDPSRRCRQET